MIVPTAVGVATGDGQGRSFDPTNEILRVGNQVCTSDGQRVHVSS